LFDPGEGTQRQLIFADVAPTVINRIYISHFHGDHCLGFGSILMRLNLDKVEHPIHCYYPAGGKKYFDRLRYGTMYHETIHVIEHPVHAEGVVHDDGKFRIEAAYLDHGVENVAWRITESDTRKFDAAKLNEYGVKGLLVRELQEKGKLLIDGREVHLDDVSWIRHGDSFAVVIDTRYCQNAVNIARGAKMLLCESTYTEEHNELAYKHFHLTAKQAATLAKEAGVKKLILTHFSARYLNLRDMEEEAKAIFPNTFMAEDLKRFPFEK
jgi:ribonuclease Z